MENKAIATLQEPSNLATLMKVAKWYNPSMSDGDLEARVIQEVGYFEYACMLNDNLATCDPRSIMMMVRWVIQNNLSIDTQAGLVYLKTRNVKQSDGSFIKVLEYEPSPEGVLSMAYSTGEIIDHQRPVIHYSGEEKPRVVGVDFSFQLSTGRWETVSYAEGHFRKWRLASHENNARGSSDGDMVKMNKANKSYTSFNGGIDPEFCTGKAIKHGLDKRGTNRIAPKRALGAAAPLPALTDQASRVTYKLETPQLNQQSNISPEYAALANPALGEPYAPSFLPAPESYATAPTVDAEVDYKEMVRRCILDVSAISNMDELNSLLEEGDMEEMYADSPEFKAAVDTAAARLSIPTTNEAQHLAEEMADQPPATPAAQSAIPLDFAPDPIHGFLSACSTMADLGNLFTAHKDKVLASDTLKAEFKKREQEINENRIAAEKAQSQPTHATTSTPAATLKITANDL